METSNLTNGSHFSDGKRHYELRIPNHNKHDLWFWPVNKKTGLLIEKGIPVRVYLGSKNLKADNLEFLDTLTKIEN